MIRTDALTAAVADPERQQTAQYRKDQNSGAVMRTASFSWQAFLLVAAGATVAAAQGNPTPRINALNPDNRVAGSAPFDMTVSGSNFREGAVVRWNGSAGSRRG